MAGRQFELEEVKTLLTTGKVGPLEGFRSKRGFPFAAIVKLGEDLKPVFEFESNGGAAEEQIDLTGLEKIAPCPVCKKGEVYEIPNAYACENALATAKTCTLRLNKMILQKQIPREQAEKLLKSGKTDLLQGFISKKGRPFSAYLKLEAGKIVFEFEPRKKKK
jgi:DNA topoisomerase-3